MTTIMYIDGGSRGNPGISGCGVYDKTRNKYTNNEAEYNGLLLALEKNNNKILHIVSDSKLLVSQINGYMKVKSEKLLPLFNKVRILISKLEKFDIKHTLREGNKIADQLANKAMDLKTDGEIIY